MYLRYGTYNECDFSELVGKTIIKIEIDQDKNDSITFFCSDGNIYDIWHDQDCCEDVQIEEIMGDQTALLNTPITMAETASNNNHDAVYYGKGECSTTWTFYKLATIQGYVTIRWLGESNGYYSEEVTFSRRR